MITWSQNNLACLVTWNALRVLEQARKAFKQSGTIKMNDFHSWNASDSATMRGTKARTLAIQLDNFFRDIRGACYENRITRRKAIDGMVAVLVKGGKTIADLAEVNDAHYRFWGELEQCTPSPSLKPAPSQPELTLWTSSLP